MDYPEVKTTKPEREKHIYFNIIYALNSTRRPHSSSLLLTPPNSSSLLLTPPHSSSLLLTPPHSCSLLLTPPHCSSLLLTPPHSSSLLLTPPHSSLLLLTPILVPRASRPHASSLGPGTHRTGTARKLALISNAHGN
jgi:hypothetical protein